MSFVEKNAIYNEMAKSTVHTFEHETTHMRVVYFENESDEYFFSYCFPTLPLDDKGKPHIVEHCTLSGSSKFPYFDPFMKLEGVSVSTFMNALTMLENTLYPASSTVFEDFKQLFAVYSDAVFSPLFRREAFESEGVMRKKQGDSIKLSGVVLSEMSADNLDKDTRSETLLNRTIFRGTPYRFNSGGEPNSIASLTYEEFVDFYKSHYEPSHCTLVLYGKRNILECLDYIESTYTSLFSNACGKLVPYAYPHVNELEFYRDPCDAICTYQKDSDNYSVSTTIHFLSDIERGDPYSIWMMTLLEDMLLGNSQSVLSELLTKSNLGGDISALSGINYRGPYSVFSFGLDDFKVKDGESNEALIERSKELYKQIISKIIRDGIDDDFVKASLKYYEFRVKEGPRSDPMGLYLTKRILSYVRGDTDDPLYSLNALYYIEKIKNDYQHDKNLFVDFLKKHFVDVNKVSLILTSPDEKLAENERIEREKIAFVTYEKEKSEHRKNRKLLDLNQKCEDKQVQIVRKTTTEMLASLFKEEHFEEEIVSGVKCVLNRKDTDGICYINVFFDVCFCSPKELQFLSFLSVLISHSDVGKYTSSEFTKKLLLIALGFSSSIITVAEGQNDDRIKTYLVFRAKVLEGDTAEFFDLLSLLFFELKTDSELAIKNAIIDEKGTLSSILARDPVSLFMNEAFAKFSNAYALKTLTKGFSYIQFVNRLTLNDRIEYALLLKKVFVKENLNIFITAKDKFEVENFISLFPSKGQPCVYNTPQKPKASLFSYPFNVFYNAVSYKTEAHKPGYDIYSALLDNLSLYPYVRRVLSAYGTGSVYLDSGEFCVYSLSDPNLKKTFEAINKLLTFDFTNDELENSRIRVLRSLASHPTMEEKASLSFSRYLSKISNEYRRNNIEEILKISRADIEIIMKKMRSLSGEKTSLGDEKALKSYFKDEKIVHLAVET